MYRLNELKEMLMRTLDEYSTMQKLDVSKLDVIDKLAHTIKNLCKIIDDTQGYSGAYYYDSRKRDDMGRYARDDYGRYSRDMHSIKQELSDIMNSTDERTRQGIQRIISQM